MYRKPQRVMVEALKIKYIHTDNKKIQYIDIF